MYFCQQKLSAYYVSCKYSNAPQTYFITEANTMSPDKNNLRPYCLQIMHPKVTYIHITHSVETCQE